MPSPKAYNNKDMNGLRVINLGPATTSSDAATKAQVDTAETNAKSRANHVGTQPASTISDFDAQVRTNRLDQMAAPTTDVSWSNRKIMNLADPGSAQDGATKAYVDAQLAGLVSGQVLKGSVRVAARDNVDTASAPTAVDGVTLVNGDLVLLTAQTDTRQNGPYIFNGAGAAMSRAANWDTDTEATQGSYWVVREGTQADTFALLTNDGPVTVGTSSLEFTFISVAGSAIGRYAEDCPAVAAGNTWTITHNLGSTDVHVMVKRVSSPYDFIDVYTTTPTANTATVQADVALAAGEFRAICKY